MHLYKSQLNISRYKVKQERIHPIEKHDFTRNIFVLLYRVRSLAQAHFQKHFEKAKGRSNKPFLKRSSSKIIINYRASVKAQNQCFILFGFKVITNNLCVALF